MFYILVEIMSKNAAVNPEQIKANLETELKKEIPDCTVDVLKVN